MILSGELAIGEQLPPARELSVKMGVSRTVISAGLVELEKLGFHVLESQTNFLFAESPAISGKELYLRLKDNGVLVRHFDDPKITNFNRITIGSEEEMAQFIETVRDILTF